LIFLLFSYKNSLYILDINPLSDIWFANIFFLYVGCLFTLLILSFWCIKKIRFDVVVVYLFCFCCLYLGVTSNKSLPSPVSSSLSSLFSSRSFIVLGLIFRSLIHFGLNFYMVYGKCPTPFFCMWTWVFPAPFVEETVHFSLSDLGTLVEDHLTIYVKVCFWPFCSIVLPICLSLC